MRDRRGPAIVAQDVGIRYDLRLTHDRTLRRTIAEAITARGNRGGTKFWALRHVTFSVPRGGILGVVGRNGSGKSTLMLALAGIMPPDEGFIETAGRTNLLTLGAGFEPELSGLENIYLNAAYLGLSRRKIERHVEPIVEFSELGEFIHVPVKNYSTGMRARLGFSIAAQIRPEVLLIDETLGVGDAAFQEKSRKRVLELIELAYAIVIVSHSMDFIRSTCTSALWLKDGQSVLYGEPDEVAAAFAADATHNRPVRAVS